MLFFCVDKRTESRRQAKIGKQDKRYLRPRFFVLGEMCLMNHALRVRMFFCMDKRTKSHRQAKIAGRPLVGLKRAPSAVLQAKRPRFSDEPGEVLFFGEVFGRMFRSTSCSRSGPSVALLRVRPCFPDFRKAGNARPLFFYFLLLRQLFSGIVPWPPPSTRKPKERSA